MKKTAAILLAVLMLVPFATIAFAANTTTLTTTVPGAAYTLNIPSDQEIAFGEFSTKINAPTVTESSGFAVNKDLTVTAVYSNFVSDDTDTTIPLSLKTISSNEYDVLVESTWTSGSSIVFPGQSNGTVKSSAIHYKNTVKNLSIVIDSANWGKAEPGNYTATITFTAEVTNA